MTAPTRPRSQSAHEYVAELVSDAPPVSDEQIDKLRDAFVPASPEPTRTADTERRAA